MCTHFNPLIPMSDQDRVSPYHQYKIKKVNNENQEKYQLGAYWLI